MSEEFSYLSILEAARLIKTRKVSPVELTKSLLGRIERLNPKIHAFITVTPELALRQAAQAEKEIGKGRYLGPLHGIPIGYKDNVHTRGIRTTAHSKLLLDFVPSADAMVVRRLADAGAVCLGKLALHEFAYGSPGHKDPFPAARNPWNLDYSPGGSSSGSGAAVAAGMAMGAVGTDTGGSVRHPAAVCGLVGMKPTFGAVDEAGVIPLSPSQDHVGPLTRTVADNAIMLNVMMGQRQGLPFPNLSSDLHCLDQANGSVRGLRIGIPTKFLDSADMHAEVREAFEASLAVLRELGAAIIPVEIPMLVEANLLGTRIIIMEAYRYHREDLERHPERFGEAFASRVLKGAEYSEADYHNARAAQDTLKRAFGAVFADDIDVIATPGREDPPITMDQLLNDPLGARGIMTRMYNLAHIPALVVPMGLSRQGLPLSLQLAAALDEEALLYKIANEFESATGWTTRHPSL
jgi:aspartyl-tRNA(Asn)/glutamyl-tRNA(Gln) amidotransferase subunit A